MNACSVIFNLYSVHEVFVYLSAEICMNSIVIKDGHTEWVLLVYSKEICMQHLYTIYSIQYWYPVGWPDF